MAKYTFIPWLRQGFGSILTGTEPKDNNGRAKVTFEVPITFPDGSKPKLKKDIALLGPGDIVNIDKRNIVRMHPEPNTSNFEPNYLPFIEFYQDSFCWDYTPEGAFDSGSKKLNPWVILIVFPEEKYSLKDGPEGFPPYISGIGASDFFNIFPKASQIWAWAHLHVYNEINSESALSSNDPDFAVSRLLCPIRLQPNTRYRACVVPVFENGRRAGLGHTSFISQDTIAWNQSLPTDFPVYHTWTFQTADAGDFESLVRRLEARPMDTSVGRQPMDVSLTAMGVPAASTQIKPELLLGGALRLPEPPLEDWAQTDRDNWKAKIANLLNLNNQPSSPSATPPGPEPVVTPPLYGRWHALVNEVDPLYPIPVPPVDPVVVPKNIWMHELNLDPRARASAGLGVRVVQDDQDHFLEMAWEQVGAILEANRLLKQGQLTIEIVSRMWKRHVETLDNDEIMALLSPILPKIVNDCSTCDSQFPGITVWQAWQDAGHPKGVLDPSVRTLMRPRGRISKKLKSKTNPPITKPYSLLGQFTAMHPSVPVKMQGRPLSKADGHNTVPIDMQVPTTSSNCKQLTICQIFAEWQKIKPGGASDPCIPPFRWETPNVTGGLDQLIGLFCKVLPGGPTPIPPQKPFHLATEICCVKIKANPQQSIKDKILEQIEGGDLDAIIPVMAHPDFPQPMYERLMKISQDFILPNVSKVPQDTLALLVANRPFIEAYMVGLNDEMSRELLWNEFPTDQRGSYFRRFWDHRGRVGTIPTSQVDKEKLEESLRDITPIHKWVKWEFLGEHPTTPFDAQPADGEQVVLLIRGELLLKYPDTLVYVARLNKTNTGYNFSAPTDTRYPQYSAKMPSDITLLGFNLSVQDIIDSGQPNSTYGWFFMICETPAGPRFGFDEIDPLNPATGTPPNDNSINWDHIGANVSIIDMGNTAHMNGYAGWNTDSASMASLLFQQPVMVAVSAIDLLNKAGYVQ